VQTGVKRLVREERWAYLGLGRAGPACLQLAVGAFVDEGVRPRMAQVAIPLNESGVGLDHVERMRAASGLGHDVKC
jgi:hypothetical protein